MTGDIDKKVPVGYAAFCVRSCIGNENSFLTCRWIWVRGAVR